MNSQPKKLSLMLAAAGVLTALPLTAGALGFGAAKVTSEIGQPLRVEIPIKLSPGESTETIKITQAPSSEYERQDVPFNSALSNLSVTFKKADKNNFAIISTSATVNEPGLQFILQGNTHQGKMLKSFNVQVPTTALKSNLNQNLIAVDIKSALVNEAGIKEIPNSFSNREYSEIYDNVLEIGKRPEFKKLDRIKFKGDNDSVLNAFSSIVPKSWKGLAADKSIYNAEPVSWKGGNRVWIEVLNEVLSINALSATVNWDKKEVTFLGQHPESLSVGKHISKTEDEKLNSKSSVFKDLASNPVKNEDSNQIVLNQLLTSDGKESIDVSKHVSWHDFVNKNHGDQARHLNHVDHAEHVAEYKRSNHASDSDESFKINSPINQDLRKELIESYKNLRLLEKSATSAIKTFMKDKKLVDELQHKYDTWHSSIQEIKSPAVSAAAILVSDRQSQLNSAHEDVKNKDEALQAALKESQESRSQVALKIANEISKQGSNADRQAIASKIINEHESVLNLSTKKVYDANADLKFSQAQLDGLLSQMEKADNSLKRILARNKSTSGKSFTEGASLAESLSNAKIRLRTSHDKMVIAKKSHQDAKQHFLTVKGNARSHFRSHSSHASHIDFHAKNVENQGLNKSESISPVTVEYKNSEEGITSSVNGHVNTSSDFVKEVAIQEKEVDPAFAEQTKATSSESESKTDSKVLVDNTKKECIEPSIVPKIHVDEVVSIPLNKAEEPVAINSEEKQPVLPSPVLIEVKPAVYSNVEIFGELPVENHLVNGGGFNVPLFKAVHLISPEGWATMTQNQELSNIDNTMWRGANRNWVEVLNDLMVRHKAMAVINTKSKEIVIKK